MSDINAVQQHPLEQIVNVHWKTIDTMPYVILTCFFYPWEDADYSACTVQLPDLSAPIPNEAGTSIFKTGDLRYSKYSYPTHLIQKLAQGWTVANMPNLRQAISSDLGGGYNNIQMWDDLGPRTPANNAARQAAGTLGYSESSYYQEILYTQATKTYITKQANPPPSGQPWAGEANPAITINFRGPSATNHNRCVGGSLGAPGLLHLGYDTTSTVRTPVDASLIKSVTSVNFSGVSITGQIPVVPGKPDYSGTYTARTIQGHGAIVGSSGNGATIFCFRNEDVANLDERRISGRDWPQMVIVDCFDPNP